MKEITPWLNNLESSIHSVSFHVGAVVVVVVVQSRRIEIIMILNY